MRDLYRQLGLYRSATPEQIEARAATAGDWGDRARRVLLQPARRAQYDRVHHALTQIGELRAALDLNDTPFGRAWWVADFQRAAARPTPAKPARPAARPGADPKRSGLAVALTVLIVALVFLWAARDPASQQPATRLPTPPTVALPPALPTPATGTFDTHSGVYRDTAIVVRTRAGSMHVLAKIETLAGETVTKAFIQAGDQWRFNLPLGTYVLKTAVGSTWYGEATNFGPRTAYSRADDVFPLRQRGEEWTVELIPQRDGNLTQTSIPASSF